MCPDLFIVGYIDPNTSQHVFSLLGPILAFLGMAGGVIVTAGVFVRHRIVSYFRKASWARRVAAVSVTVGVLMIMVGVIWWIIR